MVSRMRIVKRGVRATATPRVLGEIDDKLKLIAEVQRSVAHHENTIATAKEELLELMQKYSIESRDCGGDVAEVCRSEGKGSYHIPPEDLLEALGGDLATLFKCISVSTTKVKEFLSGKEFARLAEFTPGKPGPWQVKVFERKDKKETKAEEAPVRLRVRRGSR